MKRLAYSVIGIGGVLALLILAKGILIPFVYGIILWFLGRYFKNLIYKVPFIKKYLSAWLVSSFMFLIIVLLLSIVARIFTNSVEILSQSYPSYHANVDVIVEKINGIFQIDIYQDITDGLKDFKFASILQSIADEVSSIFGDIIMIMLYALFIISEESSFSVKLKKLFPKATNYESASNILNKINTSVSDYIRLKTLISLLTGVVSYVFLLIMGVDAPFFWALLVFFLNYIPTVGSLIATVFPAVFSLLQFGEFTPFLIILAGLGLMQWFIGNVLEPKIMGSSLNISPLVTILSLIVWGSIWGITGMLLSVPITVVLVIIFSQFEGSKKVAILLSEKGDID